MKYNIEYSNFINKEGNLFGIPVIGIFFVAMIVGASIVLVIFISLFTTRETAQHLKILVLLIGVISYYLMRYVPEKFFNVLYIQKMFLKNKRNRKIRTPRL